MGDKFIDYLQEERKKYVMKKDVMIRGVEKKNPTDIMIYTQIIRAYDNIIRKYKECILYYDDPVDLNKIKKCTECPECVMYDVPLMKCYCNTMKGKTIPNPYVIPDWCPHKVE